MERTAPCMAIAEKKVHRTDSCMNVFSHFFICNRKYKKCCLRGEEQASKRATDKEKMPKPMNHLIADGYTGGFASVEKKSDDIIEGDDDNHHNGDSKYDTRSPALVVRLMGLESMPAQSAFAGQNQKLDEHVSREDEPLGDPSFSSDVDAEAESMLQTPLKEMVRFGHGLHREDVLSPSRHHNHHPESPSGLDIWNYNSSPSSLIDVVTRISEPGLEAKGGAKYTLTHSDAPQVSMSRLKALNKTPVVPTDSEIGSLMDKHMVSEQSFECPTSKSNSVAVSSLHSPEKNKVKPTDFSTFIQNLERSLVQTENQVLNSVRMQSIEGPLGSTNSRSRRVAPPSSEAKDSVALNGSLSGKTGQVRHLSRTRGSKLEREKRFCMGQDDSLSRSLSQEKRQRNGGQKSRFLNSGSAGSQPKMNVNVKKDTVREEETDRKLCPRQQQLRQRNKNVDSSSSATGDRTKETCKVLDEKGEKLYRGNQVALNGDALGVVLDRTLKELTCEGEEEMNGAGEARRSTAVILQDLISALTTEQIANKKASKPDIEIASQTRAENEEPSLRCELRGDCCRPEADVQDSAHSIKNPDFPGYVEVTDLSDRVNLMLIKMNEAGIGLKGNHLAHARDVILNTELLFSDPTGPVAGSSLLDQLEDLGSRDQFSRAFVFDSVIEHLDCKYSKCGYSGMKPWRKLPSHVDVESVIREETGRWMKVAGKPTDKIIGWEMKNSSSGKWSDLDAEVSETGFEASSDILEGMLEELVIDLLVS